ncbi:MAG: HU family DNA-binding protein [Bacteroidota bacterium]
MRKAEIVAEIVKATGLSKDIVEATVEALMITMKESIVAGENIYMRGFGTFLLKKRAEKKGRNISKGTSMKIPAHFIPAFKPAPEFAGEVKSKVKVK